MKIKVFYPNQQGKLEFTKKELEELLNEAYHEGYQDGDRKHWFSYPYYNYNSVTSLSSSPDLVSKGSDTIDCTCTSSSADASGIYQVNILSAVDDNRLEGECNCANLS